MAEKDIYAEILKFDPGAKPATQKGEDPRIAEILKFDPLANQPKESKPAISPEPEPKPEDLEWKNVVTGAIKNTPASSYKFGENVVSALIHPIETAKTLGKTAIGIGQKFTEGEQENEKYVNAIVEDFKNAYGSVEGFKKTVAEDPVRVLADVASIVTAAGTAIRGAGIATQTGKVASAGEALSKVGASMEPLTAASKVASLPFKLVPESFPIHLYESAVKFSTELPLNERHAVTRTAISSANQIMPTVKGLTKLRGLIDELNEEANTLIGVSTQQGTVINIGRLYRGLDKIKNEIKRTSDEPLKAEEAFSEIKAQWREAVKMGPTRTPEQMQAIKQRIYKDLESYYEQYKATPAKIEMRKAIARNARKLIEEIIPEIKQVNQKEGALIELWDAIESKANRITNRDLISIGIPVKMGTGTGIGYMFGGQTGGAVGGALGLSLGILDIPQVKAKLALIINKMREKGIQIRPTMAGVDLGLYQSAKFGREEEGE